MNIHTFFNDLPATYETVSEHLRIARRSTVHLGFFGNRYVTVEGYSGSLGLDDQALRFMYDLTYAVPEDAEPSKEFENEKFPDGKFHKVSEQWCNVAFGTPAIKFSRFCWEDLKRFVFTKEKLELNNELKRIYSDYKILVEKANIITYVFAKIIARVIHYYQTNCLKMNYHTFYDCWQSFGSICSYWIEEHEYKKERPGYV